ncbi:hypothetical protein ACFLTU_02875 [Bacteroidota bacterium]
MSGRWQQRTSLKVSQTELTRYVSMALLLFAMGATAVILRTWLRIPLNIPGRQGILVMMFFMTGRALSPYPAGGIYTAAGASLMLLFPGIGPKDPWIPLIYMGMGIMTDILITRGNQRKINRYLLFSLTGGIVYMMIPLSRICISMLTEFHYSEFTKHGFLLPIISHFIFGMIGSMLGSGPVIAYRKKLNKNETQDNS